MTVLSNARIVTPGGVLACGYLVIGHGTITAVGTGDPPAPALDLAGAWLLPGFIDLHMHGGGGHSVAASADDMAAALAFHRRHGTTRSLISLVSAPLDALARQLRWVADLVAAGPSGAIGAVGAHLEGPFLSQARCGAQNPAHLLLPDRSAFARLVESAADSLRSVTIAPELPGALALISDVRAAGAVAAIGHSDAVYTEARAAIDAGAALATHLFNGMRPMHHREPGIIGAALDSGLACEVINDGIHVHPAITALVARSPESLVLVTDAIDATGVGDGEFELGGQQVRVQDGQARLAGSATLAGSTLTMDDALRRAVIDCGLSIEIAAAAAATNPARVLGLDNLCGSIAVGLDADLVVLDDDLRVVRVMAGGQWCGVEAPQFNGMATSAPTTN
ncbi:MAG TPA: N-acetylglucosamine-6-phosphate deacetylase [Jatrophihabitans sp.]|jgi:N-acetylglucosamine-6-phosphate deacetylase|uniref:N-acetylglucosamine-6-phosphate deacetylase n=1 Tax=Jatrophihabitans sp. TaxID=1932789 RepID=UPI002F08A10D